MYFLGVIYGIIPIPDVVVFELPLHREWRRGVPQGEELTEVTQLT
jgi:hypothetical protein